MAFVVILHLSSDHESSVDAILRNVTRLPVLQVTESTAIEVEHVYVISPTLQLEMDDGHLLVRPLERPRGRHVSIDLFFRTLAHVHRERAFAVVLSGTGSDGAVGLARVKEQGGVTLVQSPEDAEYDGMPRAAIATGLVDLVLPASQMPQKLLELWQNAQRIELPGTDEELAAAPPPNLEAAAQAEEALRQILTRLRLRTGHDFKHYKRATVLRRIERRLQVNALPTLPDYARFLEDRPHESTALLKDMLIGVTNFFRDREAFEALEHEAIEPLFAEHPDTSQLRIWVPGCATGEEAYSVAMLLAEQAAKLTRPPQLQVFASDIDEHAIAIARAGAYPASIAADVSSTRLREFFTRDQGQYRVRKPLRERVLFAPHNVLRDPPFSRLHLISCRNLLIYLDREVQARILEMFHFALVPGGYLFLGTSESADAAGDLFSVVDKRNRLFRSNAGPRTGRSLPMLQTEFDQRRHLAAMTPVADRPLAPLESLHRRMLEQFSPPSVLVDFEGNIIHVAEKAAEFLRYAGGVPSNNLVSLVLPELRLELRTAMFHASQTKRSVEARRVRLQRGHRELILNMTVRPVLDAPSGARFMLVLFDAVEATLSPDPAPGDSTDPVVRELEAELQRTKEQLLGTIGQSEASTEELKASNEELQAINEELRSATEELETSREELQSVNEELITVNQELKMKVDETGKINDDLQNLIASSDIATVFIDRALRIKRFTPRAADIFNIIAGDVGRSLTDLTHRLHYDQLAEDAREAFESLRLIEREVASIAGRCYLVRVLPYRTVEDRIEGAVMNFIDITERRKAEDELRAGQEQMRLVAESTKDYAIITLDIEGRVTSWNKGAERLFGYADAEMIGHTGDIVFTREDRERSAPEEERRRAREEGRAEDERWHVRKDGSRFFCSGIMTPLVSGQLHGYAKIARDLTQAKLMEEEREALLEKELALRAELQSASALKDEFLAIMSHELKHPLNLIYVNAELLRRLPEVREAPAVARAADIIRRTVVGQSQIIDDLLDLSRVHTGKLALNRVPLAWSEIIERIAEAVRPDAQASNVALNLELNPAIEPVLADPVRVEQVVWNLVSNALKFTPPGGTITLALRRDGNFGRLDVTDTGRGIAPDFIGSVFEMFRQADPRSTRQQGGLGIGLALVKTLAEAHGGRVAAASDGPGLGACFSVWLPFCEQAPPPSSSSVEAPVLKGVRILLVDDTVDTLEAFGTLLQLEGADLVTASNGPDAIAAADEQDFDLLISDIAMPGMDGYELISRLRQHPRTAGVAAIALTGFGRPGDARQALEAGFTAHLPKPVALDALLQAVDRIFKGSPESRRQGPQGGGKSR